ncbi:MAG TPA: immunoglobulin domain-containing protein [Steroidobacteraceae bacterium]|nr:immunoglobulin domain-containing protein [Steroidobacteraceae bacterium]
MHISIRRHSPLVGALKLSALCTLAVAALAACGGGGSASTSQVTSSGPVAPQISSQPQNTTVAAGQTASFSVAATGTAPFTYQWMKNSTAISGATSASYTTPATSSSDNGTSFTVSVSNAAGSMTSSAATLTVTSSSQNVAATPTFAVPGGVYASAQSVALSCSTASSTIYYTTNGTTPTTSSSAYSSAISVSATETLKAVCTATGYTNSAVASATYTINTSGTYALPADRSTQWSDAGMLTKGGIPSATWPVCNSTPLTPSGTSDDSAQINSKISQCAAGTVVQLGAGTFLMGQGNYIAINKGVVLRGAGAGTTILKNPRNVFATTSIQAPADATPIVILGPGRWVNPDGDARCAGPTAYQTAYMQLLSADGAQGSNSVTVANGSIFKAGQMVLLDEASGASWQPDVSKISTSVWASPDYAVQWPLHNPAFSGDDPIQSGVTPAASNNYAGAGSGSDAGCWFSRQDRPQNEIKEIASVSGNTITFTSPLTKVYRTSQHAELTTYTGSNAPVVNGGLEQVTLVGGGDGALRFQNAEYSWAKNIEVTEWYGEGVAIENGFRDELRDSYIHDAAWPEPGGAGYALSFAFATSEALIENDIMVKANKVMVVRSSGAGSAVGYNYMDDGYIATDEGWIEIGLNASHMVGSHMVLFEGNQSFNIDSDDTHGNSTYMVYFRNYTTSVRGTFQSDYTSNTINDAGSIPGSNGPKRAVGAMRYGYWMTYVGNVLGKQGVTTAANGYVDSDTGTTWTPTIWMLGWNDISPYTVDTNVATTAIRDGNWDWFLSQQTWLSNASAPLPNSLYLSCKPAFMGSNTWPWVDPTTGTTYTLPAQARYTAGTPNTVPATGDACSP